MEDMNEDGSVFISLDDEEDDKSETENEEEESY